MRTRVAIGFSFQSLLVLALAGALGCGQVKNVTLVESEMEIFRERLASSKYSEIYMRADSELRSRSTEGDFLRTMQKVHDRLGVPVHSERVNLEHGWVAGRGVIVTLVYKTRFTKGEGTETLVWKIIDEQAVLTGYHITSSALA